MSITEKTTEVSDPSTDFESQALLINVQIDYKETVSPWSAPSALSRNTTLNNEIGTSLHGSYTSRHDKMETQEASSNAKSTVRHDSSKTSEK